YKVSAGQIGRLKKNMHVSTHTLEMLCNILQCPVEDIMEIIVDAPAEEPTKKQSSTKNPPAKKSSREKKSSDEKTAKRANTAD
ncbi:MAG: helix-turn-helix transcriptional regulator, partial [Lachnospiraceae bacterium]|nr:helix-turn-helix transcriptional regulator [Lachnospiraceae bacterium]